MSSTKSKAILVPKRQRKAIANGSRRSLRELKAFGLWADRLDLHDAVRFTKELRSHMEHGHDAR